KPPKRGPRPPQAASGIPVDKGPSRHPLSDEAGSTPPESAARTPHRRGSSLAPDPLSTPSAARAPAQARHSIGEPGQGPDAAPARGFHSMNLLPLCAPSTFVFQHQPCLAHRFDRDDEPSRSYRGKSRHHKQHSKTVNRI